MSGNCPCEKGGPCRTALRFLQVAEPSQAALRARRLRLSTAAAAAPNRSIIGGAGTSWPPFDVLVLVDPPVLVDVELEVDEDELVEVDDEVELDEVTLPEVEELVEVEVDELTLPEVEDEDDEVTLPDDEDEVDE